MSSSTDWKKQTTGHAAKALPALARQMVFAAVFSLLYLDLVPMNGLYAQTGGQAVQATPALGFIPSKVCADCHQEEFEAWQDSHHAWALRPAGADSVLGDFSDATFDHHGVISRFFTRDDNFYIETQGPDGEMGEFEVAYTVGVEPLQQYLVLMDGQRLQALDIAWSTEKKEWFHLYPEQVLAPNDGLHWSGPYKNWNARCATCHQTNFVKAYSPGTRSYQSQWSELTVGCGACHGPGEAHVNWARKQATDQTGYVPEAGSEAHLGALIPLQSARQEIETCAPCHSRRSQLGADSPPQGTKFADHYRLSLLRDQLYHTDGQINDEVYVYGSFLQSKMSEKGVRCSDCHDPHSMKLVAEDTNSVCAQCHNPAGNAKFSSLTKAVYDSPSHHHHEPGSAGAQCVSCHMPSKTYMQVDPRRDHGFRVPRPDLSVSLGTPNACTGCHTDETANWAAGKVSEWYPEGRGGTPHFAEIFAEGRKGIRPPVSDKLIGLALDDTQSDIVRASALDLMQRSATFDQLQRITPLLSDDGDLIRSAVLRLFQSAAQGNKRAAAMSLIRDPARSVRHEAGRLLVGMPLDGLSLEEQQFARDVMGEYQATLFDLTDFPETQMQIAGLAMYLRNFEAAGKALETALEMDPQLRDAWLTLASIQTTRQQQDRATRTLEMAARVLPEDGGILFELGSLYTQARRHDRAVETLESSLTHSGSSASLLDLLAMNHFLSGNIDEARTYARQLKTNHPKFQPSPVVYQLLQTSSTGE